MENREAKELLQKHYAGTCTEEERALLESWYLQLENGEFDLSDKELELIKDQTFRQLVKSRKKESVFQGWTKYATAAILLVALSVGSLVYVNKSPKEQTSRRDTIDILKNDAAPGGNKALLTLADGSVVQLDETKTGEIAHTANVSIRKTADGQVIYEAVSSAGKDGQLAGGNNKISTPRGGQYKIILPDGTKVWLNAASSLTYPVQFTKTARRVVLTGEGYFEVAGQMSLSGNRVPFFVSTSSQTVEVLGTHFNVSAYEDEESVKTTLLEGAVQVTPNPANQHSIQSGNEVTLKPGQQSSLNNREFKVNSVNAEEAIAWKQGYFSFEQADLLTVMRQLSRWYDVDVVYGGKTSPETFTGKVYRDMTLSQVLDILDYAQINFKIEGKKIILKP